MFMIIIQVLQMDIICILIKYYFNIMYFKIILFAFNEILFNVYDHNSCISNGH